MNEMGQTLITKRLCKGQIIVETIEDIICSSQFTFPPRTNLSKVYTPNNKPYKIFLVRNLYAFYFRLCFTVSLKFSSIFTLFSSQPTGLFRPIEMKTLRDFQSVLIPVQDFSSLQSLIFFPYATMSKAQWDRDKDIDTIMENSAEHCQPRLVYSEN